MAYIGHEIIDSGGGERDRQIAPSRPTPLVNIHLMHMESSVHEVNLLYQACSCGGRPFDERGLYVCRRPFPQGSRAPHSLLLPLP